MCKNRDSFVAYAERQERVVKVALIINKSIPSCFHKTPFCYYILSAVVFQLQKRTHLFIIGFIMTLGDVMFQHKLRRLFVLFHQWASTEGMIFLYTPFFLISLNYRQHKEGFLSKIAAR